MIVRLRRTTIALAVALLTGLSASPVPPVFAGAVADPSDCGCRLDPNAGGGYCWGTLQCFRQLPDPDAFADLFVGYTTGSLLVNFYAVVNKISYSCTVTDPNRLPLAQSAIAGLGSNNAFFVWWDSSGTCQQIYINHSSEDVP
jgi:hypothetical protein